MTKAGRARLKLLFDELERNEERVPETERFDFTPLRRELGV